MVGQQLETDQVDVGQCGGVVKDVQRALLVDDLDLVRTEPGVLVVPSLPRAVVQTEVDVTVGGIEDINVDRPLLIIQNIPNKI